MKFSEEQCEALIARALDKRDREWAEKVLSPIHDDIGDLRTQVAELAACMAVFAESTAQAATVVHRIRQTSDVTREQVRRRVRKVG
jgi:hypothetical protein